MMEHAINRLLKKYLPVVIARSVAVARQSRSKLGDPSLRSGRAPQSSLSVGNNDIATFPLPFLQAGTIPSGMVVARNDPKEVSQQPVRKFLILLTVAVLLLPVLFQHCRAEVGLSLGYPYFGIKYGFTKRLALEGKVAAGEGITVYAGRGYWNFYCGRNLRGFSGLEVGTIKMDTTNTDGTEMNGTGTESAVFLGGEYFFTKHLALSADFSPTYISLKSDNVKKSGVELVTNLAVNYYFGVRFSSNQKSVKTKPPASENAAPATEAKIAEKNVAVLDFDGRGMSAIEPSVVTDIIRSEFVTAGSFSVVDRRNMEKILAEQRFQSSGCTTQDCAVQIGKILNVQIMVVGSLTKLEKTYIIHVNCIDVETGKIYDSESGEAKSIKKLPKSARIIARKLISRLGQ